MKKILFVLPFLALMLSAVGVSSTAFAASKTVEVDVMTHLCNPNVKNTADFNALTTGKDVLGGFANQVLHCPTTVLPANAPVAGTVASPQTRYDYTVNGEHNPTQMLKDSAFHSEQLCESDISEDVNGDGKISTSTCLDTSEYHFNTVMADNGKIDVREVTPPQGYHFGALLFTPTIVDQNNDQQSLLGVDGAQGRIQLDTTNDADNVITLHVYDFVNSDNPMGLVNGMPIVSSTVGTSTMTTGTTTSTTTSGVGTTTTTSIISQIQSLESQIQTLETQLVALLHQLM